MHFDRGDRTLIEKVADAFATTGMTIHRFTGGAVAEGWTTYNMLEILRHLAPETAGSAP